MTLSDNSFFYISDGELFLFDGEREHPVPSGVLERYLSGVRERAKKNEWKENGSGAIFMGSAGARDSESAVASVCARVRCVGFDECDRLLYSLKIDDVCGVYSKRSFRDLDEGMVLSDGRQKYGDFDVNSRGDICISISFAGEAHIGIKRHGDPDCNSITEGESLEASPVWSKVDDNIIYYSSAGLEKRVVKDDSDAHGNEGGSMQDVIANAVMMAMLEAEPEERARSEFSLYSIDCKSGVIEELRTDRKYDFVKPRTAENGSLYYIKKPFDDGKTKKGGCLIDILTAPVKLIGAIVGFFNVFTIKYSGKNLTSTGGNSKAKRRSDDQIYIDGNIISASRELKANADRGEKYPGFVPRSFELHRLDTDGRDTIVKKGVIAYTLRGDSIIYSNGSSVVLLSPDGSETLLSKSERVTFLL